MSQDSSAHDTVHRNIAQFQLTQDDQQMFLTYWLLMAASTTRHTSHALNNTDLSEFREQKSRVGSYQAVLTGLFPSEDSAGRACLLSFVSVYSCPAPLLTKLITPTSVSIITSCSSFVEPLPAFPCDNIWGLPA